MKALVKVRPVHAAKRDLFAELREGMAALAEERQGKRSLRKCVGPARRRKSARPPNLGSP